MKKPTEASYSPFQEAYDFFNTRLFDDELPVCLITFQRQRNVMGYVSLDRWIDDEQNYTHELAINPEYFANYPLIEICQTLCHEMVHIWQAQFGKPGRRGYHNLEWANKMIAVGLMPTSTGQPGGELVGERVSDYILHDGEFIKAFHELEAKGFQLAWKDRYPVIRAKTTTVTYTRSGTPIELDTPPPSSPALLETRSNKPAMTNLPYSLEELDAAFTAAFFPQQLPASAAIPTTKPKLYGNRHKYRCPGCYMQLWGKPDLNVVCGDCMVALVEVE